MKIISFSAHCDMWVSAVSITRRNPRTRRSMAVPLAVLAGIRFAKITSSSPPTINGMPSSPQWVQRARTNVSAAPRISATTPRACHVERTLSGRDRNQPRFTTSTYNDSSTPSSRAANVFRRSEIVTSVPSRNSAFNSRRSYVSSPVLRFLELDQRPVRLAEPPLLRDLLDHQEPAHREVDDGRRDVEGVGPLVQQGAHLPGPHVVRGRELHRRLGVRIEDRHGFVARRWDCPSPDRWANPGTGGLARCATQRHRGAAHDQQEQRTRTPPVTGVRRNALESDQRSSRMGAGSSSTPFGNASTIVTPLYGSRCC